MAGFAEGAVDGFFRGRDWREGVEARKRARKIEDEKLGWDREDRANAKSDRAYTISERDREKKRRDDEEAFWKDIAAGDGEGDNPAPNEPETSKPEPTAEPVSTKTYEPVMPAEPGSRPASKKSDSGPKPRPRSISMPTDAVVAKAAPSQAPTPIPVSAPVPPASAAPTPPASDKSPEAARRSLSDYFQQVTAPPENSGPSVAGGNPDPKNDFGVSSQELAAVPKLNIMTSDDLGEYAPQYQEAPTVMPRPLDADKDPALSALPPAERDFAIRTRPDNQKQWDHNFTGRYTPDGKPVGYAPRPDAMTGSPAQPQMPMGEDPINLPGSASARAPLAAQPRSINMGAVLAADPRLDRDTRALAAQDAQAFDATAAAQGRAVAASPLANRRMYSDLQPAPLAAPAAAPWATPPSPALAAPVTEEGTPAPSIEAAAETAPGANKPRSIIGEGMPVKTTEAQADKAANHFIEKYQETEAEKVRKFYLGRGEPEKAKAYSEWLKDESVKEGMGYWAQAVHAATVGDDDRFVRSVAKAYNSAGYYDDGYSIVPEASGIQRNPNTGEITGAQVTFKNPDGEVFTQTFDGQEDLFRMGVDMLSPEQVFEHGYSRVQAADGLRDEVAKALLKAGAGGATTPDSVLDTMKKMSDANDQFALLPMEEQVAAALQFMARFSGGGTGATRPDVPVASRPKG